jgi:hypothetical protein
LRGERVLAGDDASDDRFGRGGVIECIEVYHRSMANPGEFVHDLWREGLVGELAGVGFAAGGGVDGVAFGAGEIGEGTSEGALAEVAAERVGEVTLGALSEGGDERAARGLEPLDERMGGVGGHGG